MNSAADPAVLTDREFYRVFLFVSWETHESAEATTRRHRALEGALKSLRWMPNHEAIPAKDQLTDWFTRLWSERDAVERDGDWVRKRHGYSFPEMLITYVGLRQPPAPAAAAPQEDWAAWISTAGAKWRDEFRDGAHDGTFAQPQEIEHDGRPRMLGEAHVWTGEWNVRPASGWEAFAEATYKPGCYHVFDWGVLGFPKPSAGEDGAPPPPRFDLHTTTAAAAKAGRDRYLYWDLPHLLISFLKADQFLRQRFQGALRPWLEQTEAALSMLSRRGRGTGPPHAPSPWHESALQRAHREIETASDGLHDLIDVLTAVERDTQSVELAEKETRRFLGAGDGPAPWPVASLDLLGRQMRSDVEYGRKTQKLAECLLDKHRILGELETTRATDRLAKLGMILGAGVGAMQLTSCTPLRVAVFLAATVLCLVIYRRELKDIAQRIRAAADPPGKPS